jgi:hypothetical protein
MEKQYLDCIDSLGNCFIIYWAKVDFFLFRFVYSGVVFCNAQGRTEEKSTLSRIQKPETNEILKFDHSFLKTSVTLKRIDDPIVSSLYLDTENNELSWNCHHPKAEGEIIYNGKTYKGYGYAETLYSFIKPWNLPIDELRWGRFLSDSYTLIWIYWKGKYLVNKMFFNNIEYNDAVFDTDSVVFNNGTYQLKFSDIQVIRQGKLSGLFLKMKLLKIIFNKRILNTVEIKYKAKATLTKNSVILSKNWSLFEVVTWGK